MRRTIQNRNVPTSGQRDQLRLKHLRTSRDTLLLYIIGDLLGCVSTRCESPGEDEEERAASDVFLPCLAARLLAAGKKEGDDGCWIWVWDSSCAYVNNEKPVLPHKDKKRACDEKTIIEYEQWPLDVIIDAL